MQNPSIKKDKTLTIITTILATIIVAICVVIIFFNLTHEYHVVNGDSMLPTLNNNNTTDGVFVSTIKAYDRGDIIVYCKEDGVYVIKRLIAIGGDKISLREIDGVYRIVLIYSGEEEERVIDEPYLSSYAKNQVLQARFEVIINECGLTLDDNGFFQLNENQIFFLGDNRPVSKDCSIYGPKDKNGVVGKVDYIAYGNRFIYWQLFKQLFGGR